MFLSKMYAPLGLSPEVTAVLKQLEKDESLSNLNQAKLGKRIPFNEKALSVSVVELVTESYTDKSSGETFSKELVVFSEPSLSKKEPLIFQIAKQDKDLN